MAIRPGRIACGVGKVEVTGPLATRRRMWHWFWPTMVDGRPALSNTVRPEHLENRAVVKSGHVAAWGEHGCVAIVRNADGVEAAFWGVELSEVRSR